jgi:acetyl-CoA C-acetyltransferase
MDKRRPIIIAIGQFTNRSYDRDSVKDPMEMIEIAIEKAEEDACFPSLREKVDSLCLVNILSSSSDDPPGELAERIGARSARLSYTWIGATAPQWFVNRTAEAISQGKLRIALICGGEAFHSQKVAQGIKKGRPPGWTRSKGSPHLVGDLRDPLTQLEIRYGLTIPVNIYPLFENALRYHEGLSMDEHMEELGSFCAGMSAIAMKNPYAWFRDGRGKEEIISITGENRMISFPYTKFMCSIMEVDQSAAIFMTNEEEARALGIPREKWVYIRGCGDASDIWHVSHRDRLFESPSVKIAAEKAMEQAGVSLDDIEYLDFYSCFPCAPRITRNMLGISKDDPRPLTITGGMPYFGGPGNNYSLHAICRMVEILRENPGKYGMVQALSWFISKHSVGIYSGIPPEGPFNVVDPATYQKELDGLSGTKIVDEAYGMATVETYTVIHDREGRPVSSIIIGRLEDGRRFIAKGEDDEGSLREMMAKEIIGKRGTVKNRGGVNIFTL